MAGVKSKRLIILSAAAAAVACFAVANAQAGVLGVPGSADPVDAATTDAGSTDTDAGTIVPERCHPARGIPPSRV